MSILEHLDFLNSMKIVLASQSPRRIEALKNLGLIFDVIPSTFEENLDHALYSPVEYVRETALHKGLEVSARLTQAGASFDLIISCDSIVVFENRILEKPKSRENAVEVLTELSGKVHNVITGVTLILPGRFQTKPICFQEKTEVEFCELSQEAIAAYVATGLPMDKAGSYGIQDGKGGTFVRRIDGCFYNATGFPLHKFSSWMASDIIPKLKEEDK